MTQITRESLLENIKNYNEDEDKQKNLLLKLLLFLLDGTTKVGRTSITIVVGTHPLLDNNTEFFKQRFEEMKLVYTSMCAHSYACDCDKTEPYTKYHVISL